jgi:hypothetical protein
MSTLATPDSNATSPESKIESETVRRILRALTGIDYGSVEIIIHDSKIVQIDRKQRSRFSQPLTVPAR